MITRPRLAVFDVNETLFSMRAIGERFAELGLPAATADLWFARVLKEGFALACLETPRPFREVGRLQLVAVLAAHGVDDAEAGADHVLAAFQSLEPYPEAGEALRLLHDAGLRVCTLTNGHAETTETLLARSDLDAWVDHCYSVDAVGHWKPHPAPYRHVIDAEGVAADEAVMVAVHSWDLAGARRAGMMTAYARRLEGRHLDYYPAPDVEGADLLEVSGRLLG